MAKNTRPVEFLDYLPVVFKQSDSDGFLSDFIKAFEELFEELENAIEGTPGDIVQLTAESSSDTTITVSQFSSGTVGFPEGTPVTTLDRKRRTTLALEIPENTELTQIEVKSTSFAAALKAGDTVNLHPGGIPDLFSLDTAPPPQFVHRPQRKLDYLKYLADWIGLPLRTEKSPNWNRIFLKTAIKLYSNRGTLQGMQRLLRAWLKGDLKATKPPLMILTDLTRIHTDVDAIFQLGETATLGVDTVLGEGPPFFLIADLVTNPGSAELRNPAGLDVLRRAARFLIDIEKPSYTYYQLRIRAYTMQIAPADDEDRRTDEVYAQIGETTMLWEKPMVYDSDC